MSYQIITINREFESTGNEIAQAVATKLCIPYYDKFLITAAAEHSGVRENRVEALDEKPESRFAYSQAEAAYYFTSAEAPLPTGAKVAEVQFRLIREIAAQGPCVIVGRCANHVLRDRKDVLDIFIHAGGRRERSCAARIRREKPTIRTTRERTGTTRTCIMPV